MIHPTAYVPEPTLELRDDATPVSAQFGDVYFSRAGAVAETTHVFLDGNGLPGRWQGRMHFTIGELGFGTGLNFLVTLKRFRETADVGTELHYIAVEKYPFAGTRLRELLALQPELATEAEEFLAVYPLRLPGMHRVHFGNVRLTVCIGDVADFLNAFDRGACPPYAAAPLTPAASGYPLVAVDAWFLDGFSPAKNEAMWNDEVLTQVGQRSVPGATIATFTAAGKVKRGLQAAGFEVRKVAGFGHKREMLVGKYVCADGGITPKPLPLRGSPVATQEFLSTSCSDGGITPKPLPLRGSPVATQFVVIGAGIAGATVARALAERGYHVTVVERGQVASGASGNAAGVLFPQLTKRWNDSTAWYFTAYGFALRQLKRWHKEGLAFAHAAPGMLRLPRHAEEEAQLRGLKETLGLDAAIVHWVEREAASAQAGVALATGGAFFPQGSWVNPSELCHTLLQHPNIMLRDEVAAKKLQRKDAHWVIQLANGEEIIAPVVCVASAQESAVLLGDYELRLNAVGGQVSEFAADGVATPLRSILCHKGYIIPRGERYLVGATYHRDDVLAVTAARHEENIAELNRVLPGWLHGEAMAGRSSVRATTPDRMPYVGAVDEGLYVSTGHGSRGLLSAPLAAEIIASAVAGEMSPVSAALAKAVQPLRFT